MSEQLRTCPICTIPQPLSEFYMRRTRVRRDGSPAYQHGCKACRKRLTMDWQAQNPERTKRVARKASAAYYQRHRQRIRDAVKARHAAHPEIMRAVWRERYARRKAARLAALEQQGVTA